MSGDEMTTWRRVDGGLVFGEYDFATTSEGLADEDEPTEYVQERWVLAERTTYWAEPTPYGGCEYVPLHGDVCDRKPVGWARDNEGAWLQVCAEHDPGEAS